MAHTNNLVTLRFMRLRQLYCILGLYLLFQLVVETTAAEKLRHDPGSFPVAQWNEGHAPSDAGHIWTGLDTHGHLPAQSPQVQHGGSKEGPATATAYAFRLDLPVAAGCSEDPAHAQHLQAPALHPDRQALYCTLLL